MRAPRRGDSRTAPCCRSETRRPGAEPVAARAAATAALLNEAEAREWTGIDQQGGWCVHRAHGLMFAGFVPALAAEQGALERVARESATRARWCTVFLAGLASLR